MPTKAFMASEIKLDWTYFKRHTKSHSKNMFCIRVDMAIYVTVAGNRGACRARYRTSDWLEVPCDPTRGREMEVAQTSTAAKACAIRCPKFQRGNSWRRASEAQEGAWMSCAKGSSSAARTLSRTTTAARWAFEEPEGNVAIMKPWLHGEQIKAM